MDLDPFLPVGIDAATMRMLDVFLLHCLLADSPPDSPEEIAACGRNQRLVASRGREPGLRLERGREEAPLAAWGRAVVDECAPIAAALDAANATRAYGDAIAAARAALADPACTPSARVLRAMAGAHGNSYSQFVLAESRRHREAILALPFPPEVADRYARLAEESRARQREIEAADTMPFEEFRRQYLDPRRLEASRVAGA